MSPLVFAACLALLAGPAVHALLPRAHAWESALDGFALAVVLALCLLHLLPEALETGGLGALAAAAAGFVLLARVERAGSGTSTSALLVGGLVLHAFVEGIALGSLGEGNAHGLGFAVTAHRLPVGLLVYLAVERVRGPRAALLAVFGLALATVAGAGLPLPPEVAHGGTWQGLLSAFVAGTLLHVVLDHGLVWGGGGGHEGHDHGSDGCGSPNDACAAACASDGEPSDDHDHSPDHDHDGADDDDHGHDHAHPAKPRVGWAAVGALVGLALVSPMLGDGHADGDHAFLHTLRSLTLQSAPALLIGFVLAGLLTGLLGDRAANWIGRGGSGSQAMRGMAFGLPLPVCSCGVLPMYEALVRRGVPAAAGMAFLVATPELGLDAVLLSLPLLGVELTLARIVGAALVALAAGILVGGRLPSLASLTSSSSAPSEPLGKRLVSGVRYGLVDLFDHTVPWVVLGLVVAALAEPLLSHPLLQATPHWLQVPLFAAIGVPVYVCASGATPLAAIAVYAGVGPGAAIAFLLSGPATNITTFGILGRLHGRAAAIRFGLVVGVSAILVGWAVDALSLSVPASVQSAHEHADSPVSIAAAALLGALLVTSLFRQGPRGMLQQVVDPLEG